MTILETIMQTAGHGRPFGRAATDRRASGGLNIEIKTAAMDFAAMTPDQIIEEMFKLVETLGDKPLATPYFGLTLLVPINRTRSGAWRCRGRRFRTWLLAFRWAVRHRLVIVKGTQDRVDAHSIVGLFTTQEPPATAPLLFHSNRGVRYP